MKRKKQYTNWGGPGRGQGRRPRCIICQDVITKEQRKLGQVHKFDNGDYCHWTCLDAAVERERRPS